MTTHNATSDNKSNKSKIPCFQWRKKKHTMIKRQKTYPSKIKQLYKISCAFYWCRYHSELMCRYVNRALRTKYHQADNPTVAGGTTSRKRNSWRQQTRQRRQIDDYMLSAKRENNTIMILWGTYPGTMKQIWLKYHVYISDVDITVKYGVNIMLIEPTTSTSPVIP